MPRLKRVPADGLHWLAGVCYRQHCQLTSLALDIEYPQRRMPVEYYDKEMLQRLKAKAK